MSALGQKRTSEQVRVMSALPQKRTVLERLEMSALCQKRTRQLLWLYVDLLLNLWSLGQVARFSLSTPAARSLMAVSELRPEFDSDQCRGGVKQHSCNRSGLFSGGAPLAPDFKRPFLTLL
jgi:hypothetical protein